MEVTGPDVNLLEQGKRSSHVSCMANSLFLIQFMAAAAIETAHSGTNFLSNQFGHITDSLSLCFPSVKRSPHHVSRFSAFVPAPAPPEECKRLPKGCRRQAVKRICSEHTVTVTES